MAYTPNCASSIIWLFIKFWDIDAGIPHDVVHDELTATAVGSLLFRTKQDEHCRRRVRQMLNATRQREGIDFKERHISNTVCELFMTPNTFKILVYNANSVVGATIRTYYIHVEKQLLSLHEERVLQIKTAATALKRMHDHASELVNKLNGQLVVVSDELSSLKGLMALPSGTSPTSRCVETPYGRDIVRGVIHDVTVIMWENIKALPGCATPCYWNCLVMANIGCDPCMSSYTSRTDLQVAFYLAIKRYYDLPHATHITYCQLYQVTTRIASNGITLVHKAELQRMFGDDVFLTKPHSKCA